MGSSPPSTPSPTPSSFHPISAPIHPRPLTDSRCERTSRQRKGKKPAPLPFPPNEKETEGPAPPKKRREKQRGAPKRHSPPLPPLLFRIRSGGRRERGRNPHLLLLLFLLRHTTCFHSSSSSSSFCFLAVSQAVSGKKRVSGSPLFLGVVGPSWSRVVLFFFFPSIQSEHKKPLPSLLLPGKMVWAWKALSLFRGGSGGLGGVPRNMKRAGEEAGSATRDGGEGRGSSRILTEEKEA